MIHTFKLYGTRIALDTKSGAVHLLDELSFDMLRYLEFPIEKNCLSTLRYDLARYESADVTRTFEMFERLYADGVFGAESASYVPKSDLYADNGVIADLSVEYSAARPIFATEVIRGADSGAATVNAVCRVGETVSLDDLDIVESELERIAKEIAKRMLGKVPGDIFAFVPFDIDIVKDEKGYLRLTNESDIALFETLPADSAGRIRRKCIECALMLKLI